MWDGKRVLRPRLRGAGKNDREDDDVTVFLNAALGLDFGLYCTFRSVTTRTHFWGMTTIPKYSATSHVLVIPACAGRYFEVNSIRTSGPSSDFRPIRRVFIKSLTRGIRRLVSDSPHSEHHFFVNHARVVTNDSKYATMG